MNDDLLERIKAHVLAKDGKPPFPPVSEDAVRSAEAQLGFALPEPLRSIYLQVGDGGFGPGCGIIGVGGGDRPNSETLVGNHNEIRRGAEYLKTDFKPGLLPFCD